MDWAVCVRACRLQLKELEKLGPKMKGIGNYRIGLSPRIFCSLFPVLFVFSHEGSFVVSQSVKEVLQSLVDDNLVQIDKIGSSNCRCSDLLCIIILVMFNSMFACAHVPAGPGSLLELPFSEGRNRMFLFIVMRGRLPFDPPRANRHVTINHKLPDAKPP